MHSRVFFFIFIIFLIGCSAKLEEKHVEVKQELTQVADIGYEINSTPPNFELIDTDGNKINLDEYIANKKPVMIYFLATWCPYCAKDLTELSKAYANYSDVEIIAIDMDLNEDSELLKDYKSRYPQLQNVIFAAGSGKIVVDYNVKKTTTKYAIKDGKIIYSGSGVFSEKHWRTLLGVLSK